jgi:hypothetical protein
MAIVTRFFEGLPAYDAGWRAGMANPVYKYLDGYNVATLPVNPFNPRTYFFKYMLWNEGLHNGAIQRLTRRVYKP